MIRIELMPAERDVWVATLEEAYSGYETHIMDRCATAQEFAETRQNQDTLERIIAWLKAAKERETW